VSIAPIYDPSRRNYIAHREWREKQAAEIAAREEKARARKQATISDAERSIDEFYEEYAKKKERNIRENK
jgi:hypothetical protein